MTMTITLHLAGIGQFDRGHGVRCREAGKAAPTALAWSKVSAEKAALSAVALYMAKRFGIDAYTLAELPTPTREQSYWREPAQAAYLVTYEPLPMPLPLRVPEPAELTLAAELEKK